MLCVGSVIEETDKVTELVEVVDEPAEDDSDFREAPTQPVRIFELLDEDQKITGKYVVRRP